MNYGQIKLADTANGTGMRVTLFVSGCNNHCKGCFQPETWDFHYGKEFTKETEDFILRELQKSYYEGLTLLGGEPFECLNQISLLHLVKRVKEELPDKNIWAYTGFVYETELLKSTKVHPYTDELLSYIDILVDGRFIEEQKDISLRFRGSKNQRIIDLNETRKCGKTVLSEWN